MKFNGREIEPGDYIDYHCFTIKIKKLVIGVNSSWIVVTGDDRFYIEASLDNMKDYNILLKYLGKKFGLVGLFEVQNLYKECKTCYDL